jgi:hypothetical protein
MRRVFALFLFVVVATMLFAAKPAHAHGMRSVLIEIDELQPGQATMHVRSSVPDASLDVDVQGCSLGLEADRTTNVERAGSATCSDGVLAGHLVTVSGLGPVLSEAVVWIRYADGVTASHVLSREDSSWTLPVNASAFALTRQYVKIGISHILTGYDHLLFLFLLVLTLKKVRAVLLAETAFTLSHSLSFTATSLGWIHISSLAAETCIALSLLLVALDVERRGGDGVAPTTPSRAGVAMLAFVFGLVHGLGFAGGFAEIGLPDHDVAAALVGFGAGVEIGQVAFLAVVLVFVHVAERRLRSSWRRVALVSAYASGAISASWLIERAIACVQSG